MEAILGLAQQLVSALLSLMPSAYQRETLEAMLLMEALGHPLQHSQPRRAPCNIFNTYNWLTRKIIRATCSHGTQGINSNPCGDVDHLQVMMVLYQKNVENQGV